MTDEQLNRLRDACRLAGHGYGPDNVVILARRYLNVDLLPGSIVTDEMVAKAEADLERALKWQKEREERGWP